MLGAGETAEIKTNVVPACMGLQVQWGRQVNMQNHSVVGATGKVQVYGAL